MLMVVLLMLAMLVFMLAEAAPRMATQIRRAREKEMVFRAQQYVTAIQRYYHKFGAYPPNLARLKQTNGIHYLRQAWPDPLTHSGRWYFIHYGQVAVTGPAGALGSPAGGLQAGRAGGAITAPSLSAGGFGAGLGITSNSKKKKKKKHGFGACHRRRGSAAGMGASFAASSSKSLGGGPIIGVASRDNRPAILMRNGKDRPCEWAFIYDPGKDRTLHVMPGAVNPGVAPSPKTGTSFP